MTREEYKDKLRCFRDEALRFLPEVDRNWFNALIANVDEIRLGSLSPMERVDRLDGNIGKLTSDQLELRRRIEQLERDQGSGPVTEVH